MRDEILNSKAKKLLFAMFKGQWETEIDTLKEYVFIRKSSGKVFVMNKESAEVLNSMNIRVYSYGNYLGTILNDSFRVSIEGSQLLGPLSKKNIIELDDERIKGWIQGEDIAISEEEASYVRGFCLVKSGDDFYGCGKATSDSLLNYVPKPR
ncbi:MAG: methyltransferase RsmF C-terminal domain-like protein, partial [Nanoarchaeota archaeon]